MKERPIPFSAPMVRAILDGSKTQTRRICKPAEAAALSFVVEVPDPLERGQVYNGSRFGDEEGEVQFASPYGGIGDRLWVRETWSEHPDYPDARRATYRADAGSEYDAERWSRSIHMPRWACRIELEVTGVRVERLQAISEADADAEGCERLDSERYEHDFKLCPQCGGTGLYVSGGLQGVTFDTDCLLCDTYSKRYRHLWESINGAGSWDANPFVWVIEFKRVKP